MQLALLEADLREIQVERRPPPTSAVEAEAPPWRGCPVRSGAAAFVGIPTAQGPCDPLRRSRGELSTVQLFRLVGGGYTLMPGKPGSRGCGRRRKRQARIGAGQSESAPIPCRSCFQERTLLVPPGLPQGQLSPQFAPRGSWSWRPNCAGDRG